MANVSSNNLTTLYSGGGVNVRPTSAYGNANVVALLNAGTDGANTVTNIVATGNMTIDNITANSNITADYFFGNFVGNTSNANFATYANFANFSGNVTNSAQPNITSVGTLTSLAVTGNITSGNANLGNLAIANFFSGDGSLLSNINGANVSNVANANYANFAGTLINGTSNVRIPVANGNITFSANGVANIGVLDTTGNLTITNTIIAESANLTGTYNIDSSGYYYSTSIVLSNAGAISLPSFYFTGDFTSGSNLITNVVLTDGFSSGYTFNLADYATELTNSGVNWTQASPPFNDSYYPVNTIISSVDAPNNQIYLSNNATLSGATINNFTGTWLSNVSTNSYYVAQAPFITNAIATDATTNNISVTDFNTFNDGYVNPGDSIQFIGTGFGNITAGVDYFVNTIDYGNSTFSISTSNGGPDLGLTTDTGNLIIVYNPFTAQNIQPLSAGYYYAGPWSTTPVLTDFTQSPAGTVNSGTVLNFTGFVKPVDFNSNISPPVQYAGQFTRVDNGMVVADGSYGTPTLSGKLNDVFPVNGVVLVHTGLDANISGSRTNYQIVDYTDNSSGNPSITNPLNPPSLAFTSFNGNIDSDVNDSYARSGRTFGRIAWYGAQQVNGTYFQNPGSSPYAGIFVQALGDWNDATNANVPMVFAIQYTPLNAATGQGTSYQRINRTFLQAANNTTTIGGATNIQFKPLARSNNGTNNRSPSALGNVSINPQTFVDISGYTQGNAFSNGAGAVLNITTTSSSWNGNVALRLSRTVGNTANMEFVLPVASTNTMTLVDNASGNTIATFTDGNVNLGNLATANFFQGDGGLLSNIVVSGGTAIVNGNSNVVVSANSNVTFGVTGVANVVVVTTTGATVNGTMVANFFSGDGSNLTNIATSTISNGTSNISIPTANGNIFFSANSNANLVSIETGGILINASPLLSQNNGLRFTSVGRGGNAAGASRLYWAKQRGTIASPLSVQPSDFTAEILTTASNGTSQATSSPALIRAQVDSSYTANGANIPLGWQVIVNDTNGGINNQSKIHNFYSNGTVSFANSIGTPGTLQSGNTVLITLDNNTTQGLLQQTYNNSNNQTGQWTSWRYRGTPSSPSPAQVGDEVLKFSSIIYGDSGNTYQGIFQTITSVTENDGAGNTAGAYTVLGLGANSVTRSYALQHEFGNIALNTNATIYGNGSASFVGLTANGNANIGNLQLNQFQEDVYAIGSTSGTITPDFNNGSIQSMTLTGSITMNTLGNAVAGRSMVLVVTQGGTGSYTLTSSMKFAGAYKTLSTAVGATDIISVFYDGATYYASLSTGYA